MLITTTVYISPAGGLRIAPKNGRPIKGEIVAALELDVPDSAFQPPSLTLRASVATGVTKPAPILPEIRNGQDDTTGEWTPERLRKLQALLDISREELARRLDVPVAALQKWQSGGGTMSRVTAGRLTALEAQTKGVTT